MMPGYDVQWDIEYICQQPGKETTVYHSPCDLMCMHIKIWDNVGAETLLDWYKWGSSPTTYLSRLIDLMRKGN